MDSKLTDNYDSIIFDFDETFWDNTSSFPFKWNLVNKEITFFEL